MSRNSTGDSGEPPPPPHPVPDARAAQGNDSRIVPPAVPDSSSHATSGRRALTLYSAAPTQSSQPRSSRNPTTDDLARDLIARIISSYRTSSVVANNQASLQITSRLLPVPETRRGNDTLRVLVPLREIFQPLFPSRQLTVRRRSRKNASTQTYIAYNNKLATYYEVYPMDITPSNNESSNSRNISKTDSGCQCNSPETTTEALERIFDVTKSHSNTVQEIDDDCNQQNERNFTKLEEQTSKDMSNQSNETVQLQTPEVSIAPITKEMWMHSLTVQQDMITVSRVKSNQPSNNNTETNTLNSGNTLTWTTEVDFVMRHESRGSGDNANIFDDVDIPTFQTTPPLPGAPSTLVEEIPAVTPELENDGTESSNIPTCEALAEASEFLTNETISQMGQNYSTDDEANTCQQQLASTTVKMETNKTFEPENVEIVQHDSATPTEANVENLVTEQLLQGCVTDEEPKIEEVCDDIMKDSESADESSCLPVADFCRLLEPLSPLSPPSPADNTNTPSAEEIIVKEDVKEEDKAKVMEKINDILDLEDPDLPKNWPQNPVNILMANNFTNPLIDPFEPCGEPSDEVLPEETPLADPESVRTVEGAAISTSTSSLTSVSEIPTSIAPNESVSVTTVSATTTTSSAYSIASNSSTSVGSSNFDSFNTLTSVSGESASNCALLDAGPHTEPSVSNPLNEDVSSTISSSAASANDPTSGATYDDQIASGSSSTLSSGPSYTSMGARPKYRPLKESSSKSSSSSKGSKSKRASTSAHSSSSYIHPDVIPTASEYSSIPSTSRDWDYDIHEQYPERPARPRSRHRSPPSANYLPLTAKKDMRRGIRRTIPDSESDDDKFNRSRSPNGKGGNASCGSARPFIPQPGPSHPWARHPTSPVKSSRPVSPLASAADFLIRLTESRNRELELIKYQCPPADSASADGGTENTENKNSEISNVGETAKNETEETVSETVSIKIETPMNDTESTTNETNSETIETITARVETEPSKIETITTTIKTENVKNEMEITEIETGTTKIGTQTANIETKLESKTGGIDEDTTTIQTETKIFDMEIENNETETETTKTDKEIIETGIVNAERIIIASVEAVISPDELNEILDYQAILAFRETDAPRELKPSELMDSAPISSSEHPQASDAPLPGIVEVEEDSMPYGNIPHLPIAADPDLCELKKEQRSITPEIFEEDPPAQEEAGGHQVEAGGQQEDASGQEESDADTDPRAI